MAERNYTITIELPKEGDSNSPISADNRESPKEELGKITTKDQARSLAKKIISYSTAKSFAVQVINHHVSLYGLRTGSNELQQRANFINGQVQGAVGVIESMVMGGAAGGPVGALAMLGVSIAHQVVSYSQRQQTLNIERSLEDVTLMMGNRRAGAKGYRNNE